MNSISLFVLSMVLIVYILREEIYASLRVLELGHGSSFFQLFAYIGMFLISMSCIPYYNKLKDNISKPLFLSYFYAAFITFVNGLVVNRLPPSVYVYILLIPLVYLSFKNIIQSLPQNVFNILLFVSLLLLILVYIQTYNQIMVIVSLTKDYYIGGSSYIFLYLLPLFLCVSNVRLKWFGVIICSLCVLLSFKRSGSISMFLGLLLYYWFTGDNKMTFKRIFTLLLFLLTVFVGVYLLNDYLGNFLFERFESLGEDQGSGRFEIYEYSYRMIKNSDLLSFVFGHGWNSVKDYSIMGLSAHNDYLEIWYDFGLLGFSFYCYLLVQLLRLLNKMHSQNSKYAGILACSLCIFFFNSTFSHIFIYPWAILLFVITWATLIALFNKSLYENRNISI